MKTGEQSKSFGERSDLGRTAKDARGIYLARCNEQVENYVRDLECSLAINKTIVEELVKKHVWSLQEKRVVEKLSRESSKLQQQVKSLTQERDALQMKLLIAEQINASYTRREAELMKDMGRAKQQYASQLHRKSYLYQTLEKKHEQVLEILKLLARNDPKVAQLLVLLNVDCSAKLDAARSGAARERSLSKERESTMGSELFDEVKRERKQSMKAKMSPIVESEKEAIEKEANRLRERVLDLYRHNLKLKEELRIEKKKSTTSENLGNDLFQEGSLKRWHSTNKKPQFENAATDKAVPPKVVEEIQDEANTNHNSFSWGKPLADEAA